LVPGTPVPLPDELGTIELGPIPRFASLEIAADPTQTPTLIAAVVAMAGLALSLFVPRRRLWVRATTGRDGGTVLEVAGLARGDDPACNPPSTPSPPASPLPPHPFEEALMTPFLDALSLLLVYSAIAIYAAAFVAYTLHLARRASTPAVPVTVRVPVTAGATSTTDPDLAGTPTAPPRHRTRCRRCRGRTGRGRRRGSGSC
jgi:hypothetical protein